MEGELEIWTGIRWKRKYCILQNNILSYCNKNKREITGKIHLKVSIILEEKKKKREFKINNGVTKFWFRAKTDRSKERWLQKLKSCKAEKIEEKIDALKKLMNEKKNFSMNKELKQILEEKEILKLSDKIAVIWENAAVFKREMCSLKILMKKKVKKKFDDVIELSENLRRDIYTCLKILEKEKMNLLVVNNFYKKKEILGDEEKNNTNFKFCLEKELNETKYFNKENKFNRKFSQSVKNMVLNKTNITIKNSEFQKKRKTADEKLAIPNFSLKSQTISDTENSFYSLEENSEIFKELEKSFFIPQKKTLTNSKAIKKLITENEVFKKYPILPKTPENRKSLPIFFSSKTKLNGWSILKSNLGKDLTKVTIPIYFNEPHSALQSIVSFVEYKSQFEKAYKSKISGLKTGLVLSAFFMILVNAANTNKKPFNPLLGETYEVFESDGLRLITEQVSHHPPITAFFGENEFFQVSGFLGSEPKLSLKGFRIVPKGETFVKIKSCGTVFSIKRPDVTVHNYIVGKMYIWNFGEMICENLSTNERAVMKILPKGWSSKNDFKAVGSIFDKDGNVLYKLNGRWDSFIEIRDLENNVLERKDKIESVPDYEKQYNYSLWGINCNHLTQKMLSFLAPTDSRLRPDQRAFEYGDMTLAAREKARLESSQRERRKIRKIDGVVWKPNWFDFEMEGKKVVKCEFKGDFWNFQKKNDWKGIIDIFN